MSSAEELRRALVFCRDIAAEELAHSMVGTGAEVALRHIVRKADEALKEDGGGHENPRH